MSLGYKKSLLTKLQNISESCADEVYVRIETLPAKELVGLLSSSIQLQSVLEQEIKDAEKRMEEGSEDTIVEAKYEKLGVNRNKIVNLLDNFA